MVVHVYCHQYIANATKLKNLTLDMIQISE